MNTNQIHLFASANINYPFDFFMSHLELNSFFKIVICIYIDNIPQIFHQK